jgi:hypothetical protein
MCVLFFNKLPYSFDKFGLPNRFSGVFGLSVNDTICVQFSVKKDKKLTRNCPSTLSKITVVK